jgi:bifunctional UDP-N-acetylglucosamine pyrophosphorylase/glucosamine-1-phosphate N-acetyltransferase
VRPRALKEKKGLLYILYGDVPLLRPETLASMREVMKKDDASLVFLTADLRNPTGYGRVVREMSGAVAASSKKRKRKTGRRKLRRSIPAFIWSASKTFMARFKK